ncbi:hypothetical protein [Labilibaculum euxinus]
MKKLLFIVLVVFITHNLFSQTNVFPEDGNISIYQGSSIARSYDVYNSGNILVSRFEVTSDKSGQLWFKDGDGLLKVLIKSHGTSYFNGGNVGIGTSSPNAKLEVIGDGINASRISLSGNINDRINDSPWYGIGYSNFTSLSYEKTKRTVQLAGYYGLMLKTSEGVLAMHQNGNIGIGTCTPAYKLDVLGTIRARELKVDMQGADFVFEENYVLRPIEELEGYIIENKHLPEIVTAKEMQENGVNQSEMNQKLLQKIEELTLYTIAQEKKIAAFDKQFKKQENDIIQLRNLILKK